MDINTCFKVGYILKPHGLKGEVTVSIDPEMPVSFDSLDAIFVDEDGQLVPYFIESVSARGDKAYVKFEDINSADDAGEISKRALYLPKAARPKAEKGTFYDDEITGFVVYEETDGLIGTVSEVQMAGANRLLVVENQGKETLIPVQGPFITAVDKSKKRIDVTLPEGFLDI